MRIVLDETRCSSLGLCEAVAPDLFEVGDDGALRILDDNPGQQRRGLVLDAIQACPTGALSLQE